MRARSVAGLVLLSCRMRPHLFPSCTTRLSRWFWDAGTSVTSSLARVKLTARAANCPDIMAKGFLCIPLPSPVCLRLHSRLCCSPSALWFCDDLLGSPSSSFAGVCPRRRPRTMIMVSVPMTTAPLGMCPKPTSCSGSSCWKEHNSWESATGGFLRRSADEVSILSAYLIQWIPIRPRNAHIVQEFVAAIAQLIYQFPGRWQGFGKLQDDLQIAWLRRSLCRGPCS